MPSIHIMEPSHPMVDAPRNIIGMVGNSKCDERNFWILYLLCEVWAEHTGAVARTLVPPMCGQDDERGTASVHAQPHACRLILGATSLACPSFGVW